MATFATGERQMQADIGLRVGSCKGRDPGKAGQGTIALPELISPLC